jgi:hypothetical protein
MLRGTLLVRALLGAYFYANQSNPWSSTVALLILVLVYSLVTVGAPAVWSSQAAMYAYWTSRTQNLVWNNTHCQGLTFRSRLHARPRRHPIRHRDMPHKRCYDGSPHSFVLGDTSCNLPQSRAALP